MKFAVFASLLVASLSAPALAADWVLVSDSVTGTKFYIDRQSIRTMPNGYKRAWVRGHYGKTNTEGSTGFKSFEEFDCAESRKRALKDIFYKGEEISLIVDTIGTWKYIPPESHSENVLNFACYVKR